MLKKMPHLPLYIFIVLAACFITFQITYTKTDDYWTNKVTDMLFSGTTKVNNAVSEISEIVDENFLYTVDENTASAKIMQGYAEALDRFSMYMTEKEYQEYLAIQNSPSKTGIGVNTLFDSNLEGVYVVSVYKNSPAASAGIVPGDIIVKVDGKSVNDMGFYTAMSIIGMGEENTSVNVTVKKLDGTLTSHDIVRKSVKTETITGEKLQDGVGLIKINGFATGDDEFFKTVLENLIVSGCEKFVLDVRNNSGGNIETISRMLDFLLPDVELFTITDKSGAKNTVISDMNSVPYPLAVLVNEGTVGGAEVFAAALSNSDRVSLFGTRTYGKATTQSVFALSSGGAVSISTTIYTPGNGKSFENTGVEPHAIVELPTELKMKFTTLAKEEDAPLKAAVSYLETQSVVSLD